MMNGYIGTYVIGKQAVLEVGGTRSRKKGREKWFIIPDHHEPLIEKALFERIQANATRFFIPNKKSHTYPLRGKVICGCCGHALTRVNRKIPYYICRHSAADERFSCHGVKILADDLEQTVFSTLKHQVEVCMVTDLDVLSVEALIPERAEYDQQAEQTKETDDRRRNREQVIQEITEADKLTNELSELLIEKVYVFAGNRIEIAYKMQDIFS